MPPSLQEWLREEDLAWFIVDAVEQMELGEFYAAYREDGWGAAAYDPAMMVSVLLYAYCQGLRSSRRIAMALERDVGFRVVVANAQPDFRTICRFRAEHEEALEKLFAQVLVLQRQFREGCGVMPAWRRGAWHGSVWPVRYCPAYPQATAATRLARTVPGAAFPAPPGRPAAS